MSLFLLTLPDSRLTSAQMAQIKEQLPPHLTFWHSRDDEAILARAEEVEVVAGWFRPRWLTAMSNLRWVQSWGAGTNWLMKYPELQAHPFVLTNGSGIHAVPISEHIFGTLLALGRQLRNAHEAQQAKVWAHMHQPREDATGKRFAFSSDEVFELADKTMVLLGVGAIGERTAKIAQAFDMQVIGVRRDVTKTSPYVDEMVPLDELHRILPLADFVVITLPLTAVTHHIIGHAELALLKSSAYIVNIGRGSLIDEAALLPLLQEKRIGGAALDVFEEEPLPEESPFWSLDNLLITSHYSGGTPRYDERAMEILLDNFGRYQAGSPLRNVVDKQLGY